MKAKINEVNENLGKILEKIVPLLLSDLNHLIFASAAYVSQPKKEIDKNNVQAKPKIFRWKIKLQEKIKNLRKDLSIIEEILKDNKSLKVKTKANLVKKKLRMEENSCEEISEALKQRIQAKAHRIQRYDKRKRFFEQNRLFNLNAKKFYKEINGGNAIINKPPNREETAK